MESVFQDCITYKVNMLQFGLYNNGLWQLIKDFICSNETCYCEARISTFESANVDTPPATSNVQIYSGIVYLIP